MKSGYIFQDSGDISGLLSMYKIFNQSQLHRMLSVDYTSWPLREFKFHLRSPVATMASLQDVLVEISLEQYLGTFEKAGFNTWEKLSTITELELAALNIPRGHRRRLQREVARRSGWPEDQPLPRYNSFSGIPSQ